MISEASIERTKEQDAHSFLVQYRDELLGVLEDPIEKALVNSFTEDAFRELSPDEERHLAAILERFETKIFEYTKPEVTPGAKRVLVTCDNPGAWNAILPLVLALEQDSRCGGVTAVVSGVAGKQFKETFPKFTQIRSDATALGDALSLVETKPIDIAIASASVKNGPENLALFAGKSSLGAVRTYLIFEGYGGPGGAFKLPNTAEMEHVDGIFCNDALAKAVAHEALPQYPVDHIYVSGILAAEGFELTKATEYRLETRRQLDIAENAFVVLYAGDVSSDYASMSGADPDINTKTFKKSLASIETAARNQTERPIALIVRPHPRAPDKDIFVNAGKTEAIPENLTIKDGSKPLTFNQVAYAADVVVSIMSTENIFAPARGRRSVFLAYTDEPGLGGQALETTYSPALIEAMRQIPGVYIASSPQEFAKILEQISGEPPLNLMGTSAVSTVILDKIFE